MTEPSPGDAANQHLLDAPPFGDRINQATIRETQRFLGERIRETPVFRWSCDALADRCEGTQVTVKLELFQNTGTFKVRGAFNVALRADPEVLARGITAVSAGNHAIAAAYVARKLGVRARMAIMDSVNPFRLAACKAEGAEVHLVKDGAEGIEWCEQLAEREGLLFIHPFEGIYTSLGTATVGAELVDQVPGLDAVIVPIGGGGLASGVAAAVKLLSPSTAVFGVEPTGAPTMTRSFENGGPVPMRDMNSVADSLKGPFSGETTHALCHHYLDDIVLVEDEEMHAAQALLYRELKLAAEPATAAATAALVGPLRERLAGKKVGVIACGANIGPDTLADQIGDLLIGELGTEVRP